MGCLQSFLISENGHPTSSTSSPSKDSHIQLDEQIDHEEEQKEEEMKSTIALSLSNHNNNNHLINNLQNNRSNNSHNTALTTNSYSNIINSITMTSLTNNISSPYHLPQLSHSKSNDLRVEDFIIHDFLAKGGMGSVYYGIRKSDQFKVAFKFFGYDEKCPDMEAIQLEISALTALRGLEGVISLIGTFLDSASGFLGKKAYKIWPKKYPILVMPLLEGGALIDRIHVRSTVSENDLKNWFTQFIIGLGNIHLKGYIHRDIKLENIMLETMADDSPV